jgi:hypothetical protein
MVVEGVGDDALRYGAAVDERRIAATMFVTKECVREHQWAAVDERRIGNPAERPIGACPASMGRRR